MHSHASDRAPNPGARLGDARITSPRVKLTGSRSWSALRAFEASLRAAQALRLSRFVEGRQIRGDRAVELFFRSQTLNAKTMLARTLLLGCGSTESAERTQRETSDALLP